MAHNKNCWQKWRFTDSQISKKILTNGKGLNAVPLIFIFCWGGLKQLKCSRLTLAQIHWHHSSPLIRFSIHCAIELRMGDPFPARLSVAGRESGCTLFLIRCHSLHWNHRRCKLFPQEYVSFPPWFRPLSLCFCLFVLPDMWQCFFQRKLWNVQLQLQTLLLSCMSCALVLYLLLISDRIISLLLVSVRLFVVNFGLFLAVSAVATVAKVCLLVSHVSSWSWSPPAGRNRSHVGRAHTAYV